MSRRGGSRGKPPQRVKQSLYAYAIAFSFEEREYELHPDGTVYERLASKQLLRVRDRSLLGQIGRQLKLTLKENNDDANQPGASSGRRFRGASPSA